MKMMALDIGDKRIGIATCDKLEIASSPHSVISADETAIQKIIKIIETEAIEAIVIGIPISLKGHSNPSCERVHSFINMLKKYINLPIFTYDERFTTNIAEEALIAEGLKREKRRSIKDAISAAIILRDYIDAKKKQDKY